MNKNLAKKIIEKTFLLFLILTFSAVGSYGQNYELDTIYSAESVDTLPVSEFDGNSLETLARNHVYYPFEAQKTGIEGTVIVSFIVYKNGSLGDVKVVESPDSLGLLDRAALRIVKGFYLKPAIKDGRPVSVRINSLHFNFHSPTKNSDFENEIRYLEQDRKYYSPNYALFIGRFYVSGQIGCWGLLNPDFGSIDSGFLTMSKNRNISSYAEIAAGKIFRDRRRIGFSAGLGLRTMCYEFEEKEAFNLTVNGSEIYGDYSAPEVDQFKKHFLQIRSLILPLGMSFRFNTDKQQQIPCEVNIYATGTMRFNSREKQVYKIDGIKKKMVFVDDFMLRRFWYDVSLELLFEVLGVRYTYSPLTLFDGNVSPKVHYQSVTFSFKFGIR